MPAPADPPFHGFEGMLAAPGNTLWLSERGTSVIRVEHQAPTARHLSEVSLKGRPWEHLELPHFAITPDRELTFAMMSDPHAAPFLPARRLAMARGRRHIGPCCRTDGEDSCD
jgi:hypothetical protein